jgi:hypothetical protein
LANLDEQDIVYTGNFGTLPVVLGAAVTGLLRECAKSA